MYQDGPNSANGNWNTEQSSSPEQVDKFAEFLVGWMRFIGHAVVAARTDVLTTNDNEFLAAGNPDAKVFETPREGVDQFGGTAHVEGLAATDRIVLEDEDYGDVWREAA